MGSQFESVLYLLMDFFFNFNLRRVFCHRKPELFVCYGWWWMLDGWLIFSKVEINLVFRNITKTFKLYPCCRGWFSKCYRMLPVKQTKNVTTLHKSNFLAIFLLNTTSIIWFIFLSSVVIVFWKDIHFFVKWEQKCLPGFEYPMGYSIDDFFRGV